MKERMERDKKQKEAKAENARKFADVNSQYKVKSMANIYQDFERKTK